MSIVVAMMFPNGGVVMYADKRSVTRFGDRTVVSNDFIKIHRISETVVCGITGWAEWGLLLIKRLKAANLNYPSDIIEYVKSFSASSLNANLSSTVTLGGIYDNGKPFLWTYRGNGIITFEQEGVRYSIATDPEILGEACERYFKMQLQNTGNIHQALQNVIKYAAAKNPENISQEYDKEIIRLKP